MKMTFSFAVLAAAIASVSTLHAQSAGQVTQYSINSLNACNGVPNLPYAEQLYCRAAFNAAQSALGYVTQALGTKVTPTSGNFYYYATTPDGQNQTKINFFPI